MVYIEVAMKYTKIVITEERRIEATKWAREHFGMSRGENGDLPWNEMIWYKQGLQEGSGFYFRDPQHATAFALRWL